MAEEVKKARRPVDPNSAKYKLGKIAADAFADAIEAKKQGRPVAWVSSNFPVEIPETLGLATAYPENQAAGIAARGAGQRMCEVAESEGYSNDICAYARVSLAYAKLKECPEQDVAMPDVLLCCNNICNCMIKWYENLSRELNIPMILLDIPFNPDYDVPQAEVDYVSAQFWDAVHQLEDLFDLKWDDEKFKEVTGFSCRSSRAWLAATAQAKYVPSPFNGFDLLNHMAVMVTARGKAEAADAMELLLKEYKQNHKEGKSTFRVEEKYRIMFEGIACWPYLRVTSHGLKDRGINMVTTIYADAFGFDYNSFDEMIRAYCSVPNAINLEKSRDKRIKLCRDNHVEGLLVHTNRSCKLWSGFMYEMSRQIGEACDIPVTSFDGDQADPRNFSEAQYDTRVQGLMEIMEQNKQAKGAN
jgi:benzoyl-CoA reductase/2-hydroxyglutaryl-CoA dehydratase subunit BcrC/BadD/HgdB